MGAVLSTAVANAKKSLQGLSFFIYLFTPGMLRHMARVKSLRSQEYKEGDQVDGSLKLHMTTGKEVCTLGSLLSKLKPGKMLAEQYL